MDVVRFAVDEPLVNTCPRKAFEASAEVQSRSASLGDFPFASTIAAVCFAQITAEHGAELFDVVLGWFRGGQTKVQQSEDVVYLGDKRLRIIGGLAELLLDEHHAKLSGASGYCLEFGVRCKIGRHG